MNKSETNPEIYSVSQITVALLLLTMVLLRDSIDNEMFQAICLACILSLVITEVELSQDKDNVPELKGDMATADFSGRQPSLSADPPAEAIEELPSKNTPHDQTQEASEVPKHSGASSATPSTASYRRPVEVYNSIPSGRDTNYHQGITWKPMPPKSIVPTKHVPNKESHNLSIRFVQ
ncbi:MAG: hypothetical protein ACM3UW_04270 [Bacillota bacterium]